MRLKAALKISAVERILDGDTLSYPSATRRSNGVEWRVITAGINQISIRKDVKIRIFRKQFTNNTHPEVEKSWLEEYFDCERSILWNSPLKYIIHIVGRRDWEPS